MLSFNLYAQSDSSTGTIFVNHNQIQASGDLVGCELEFLATVKDVVYLNGNLIAVNGSIGVNNTNNGLIFSLKIGLKDLAADSSFLRPTFAYIQTENYSTAKTKQISYDADNGYRLIAYNATDSTILKVLMEIMDNKKVSVCYNRRTKGRDVIVPIDMTVSSAKISDIAVINRQHSQKALLGFSSCMKSVFDSYLSGIKDNR
jgi:hypothetical protein